ncbi:hypothetical protein BST81_11800 [Leptolyngbya sp. 'hensonii']|uniref:GUN4 domain-containing protein n=1 Tax=Leptolyngbya sp. 'hensonii' TaxID=1922337 RepID=UPI00094FB6F3|nr:GUN4 domain-containing protein [Leptolyngbya sp. 'hensonii']OLP18235.1 hypothetical protein BST81_11800 [Leptolyngbya sp. 'hensonii']
MPDQPRSGDLVLGGQTYCGTGVLGGLEGVKWRLASPQVEQRILALQEALNYGAAGLKLIIAALRDRSGRVEEAAVAILQQRSELDATWAVAEEYVPLRSAFGVDYRPLRDWLGEGNWQAANQETWTIVFRLSSSNPRTWLQLEQIQHFPCLDLQTIDRLWQRHSDGRFGFGVQARLWRQIWVQQPTPKGTAALFAARTKAWEQFTEQVGWSVGGRWLTESEIHFTLEAPLGHFPIGLTGKKHEATPRKFLWTDLFSRIENCERCLSSTPKTGVIPGKPQDLQDGWHF